MISQRVWPALKAAGFKRSSGTFRLRSGDGDAIVLEFQGSQGSAGDLSLFYLNMAASTGGWLRWQESRGYARAFWLPGTTLSQWWAASSQPPASTTASAGGGSRRSRTRRGAVTCSPRSGSAIDTIR
jgi:hypothetical protein